MKLKFEVAERFLSDSRTFFYFRLFMINDFVNRRAKLIQRKPDSPRLLKLTPLSIADQYKTIMF